MLKMFWKIEWCQGPTIAGTEKSNREVLFDGPLPLRRDRKVSFNNALAHGGILVERYLYLR